ncbi:MAG: IS110 family transposase [Arachnia sp.]
MSTMTHPPRTHHPALDDPLTGEIIGGVDTHADTHTVAAVTSTGGQLATTTFPTTPAGYQALLAWLVGFGTVTRIGVEGTGAYGAGLTAFLTQAGITVFEVNRPDRSTRRLNGKSDPLDAVAAARAVIAGTATTVPKRRDHHVEALRVLHLARKTAVNERADLIRKIKSVIITAPAPLREQLRGLNGTKLHKACLALRPDPTTLTTGDPTTATKYTLRDFARTWRHLNDQILDHDHLITTLLKSINPALLEVRGIGPAVAAQLLITAGDNPNRINTEASFAMLTGAAPIPASSGKIRRYRLNRGGDRQAHSALWRIAITRLAHDPTTRTYMHRRTTEGKSKQEIIRCLIRYIAREIHPILTLDNT